MLAEPTQLTQSETRPLSGQFLKIKITRDPNGLVLHLHSSSLEGFIRQATSRPDLVDSDQSNHYLRNPAWGTALGYQMPSHHVFHNNAVWGGRLLTNGQANTAFLLAKGIKDGVNIKISGLYTEKEIEEFTTKLKVSVKELYREFMRPFAKEFVVMYEEM